MVDARRSFAIPALLLLGAAAARTQTIEVGANVRITERGGYHVEPHIAAHPRDADKLVVSVSHFESGSTIVEPFSTTDAGTTWSGKELPGLRDLLSKGQLDGAADTRVLFGPGGDVFCVLIAALKSDDAWGRTPILLYRSAGIGAAWQGPTPIGPLYDRPTLLASGGQIYIAAMAPGGRGTAAVLLKSDDRGATFQRSASLTPDSLGHQPMNPVLSGGGTLVLPYVDFPRHKEALHSSRVYAARSRDMGINFDPPIFVADIPRPSPGSLESASGSGAIYLAWNGGPEGRQNLTVARSTDEGETWAVEIVAREASFGSVAVSANGTLGVAWIQHPPAQPECWHAYFAASTDRGRTFSPPSVISTALSCPSADAKKTAVKFQRGSRDYGDYIGLASAADGTFHPIWIDARNGALDVYTAAIKVR